MTADQTLCPDCSTPYADADNYCRNCGMYLAALRPLPVASNRPSRALEPVRPGLPAPVKKAATAVAIGTALQIGVGLAGKYMARQAAKQAGNRLASAALKPRNGKVSEKRNLPAKQEDVQPVDPLAGATAVSETLMIRRVWVRRD